MPQVPKTRGVLPEVSPQFQSPRGATGENLGGAIGRGAQQLGKGIDVAVDQERTRIARELRTHTQKMLSNFRTGDTVDDAYWQGLSNRTGLEINRLQEPLRNARKVWGYSQQPGQLFLQKGVDNHKSAINMMVEGYTGLAPSTHKDSLREALSGQHLRELEGLNVHHQAAREQAEEEIHVAEITTQMDAAIDGYQDTDIILESELQGLMSITRHGLDNGDTMEKINLDRQSYHTELQLGVINRFLANNEIAEAKEYYDRIRNGVTFSLTEGETNVGNFEIDLTGDAKTKIEAALTTASAVQTASIKAEGDEILDNVESGIDDPRAESWLVRAEDTASQLKPGEKLESLKRKIEAVQVAVSDRPLVEQFNALPFREQRQLIDTMIANRITKPKDQRELDRAERQARLLGKYKAAHDKTQKAIDDGQGLLSAAQNIPGVKEKFEPINWANPDPVALYNRARLAETLSGSEYYGQTVAPLTKQEAEEISGILKGMSSDQATAYVGQLSGAMGLSFLPSVTGVMVDSGQPELGIAIYHGGTETSREILHGLRVKGSLATGEGSVFKLTATNRRDAVEAAFGPDGADVLNQLGEDAGAFISAADAIYYSRAQRAGENDFDDDRYEEALREALGGTFTFNGFETIAPVPGMDQETFESMALAITSDDLRMFGNGAPMTADGAAIDLENLAGVETIFGGRRRSLDRPYQLVYVGPGRYQFRNSLGFISADGSSKRFEFDMRAYMESKETR